MEYYLLLGRLLVAGLLFTINFWALIAERKVARDAADILATRPIARAALKMLWWLCLIQTVAIIGIATGSGLRDFYAGEAFLHEAPTWVVWTNVAQTIAFYAVIIAPAVALMGVMREVRASDKEEELEEARREGWLAKEAECPDCPEHIQRQHHPERFPDTPEGKEALRRRETEEGG